MRLKTTHNLQFINMLRMNGYSIKASCQSHEIVYLLPTHSFEQLSSHQHFWVHGSRKEEAMANVANARHEV